MKKQYLKLMFILLVTACGKTGSGVKFSVNEDSRFQLDPNNPVTYSELKANILTPHCLNCHSDVGTETGIQKWITAGDPEGSPLFTSVKNGSVPKNQAPLGTDSLEMIWRYIEQMAPVTPTPTPPPSTNTGITFEEIKTKVLTPYRCLNCHSVGTEAKLSRWINTTSPSSSSFYTTMKNGSMPRGGTRADTATLNLVLQYVKDFANR